MAAALGLALAPGDVAVSLGTSGTVYAVSARPTADPSGAVAGFADATGRFLPLVCTLNATKVTDTVAGWLGTDAPGLATLALAATPRPEGPIVVPYFDGERTPNLPNATGLLAGIRTATTREELALAAFDGVLCGLLDGRDALAAAGADVGGQLHLVGGGARSRAYRQRLADLAGTTIVVPHADEVVATGACVQAAAVHGGENDVAVARRWGLGRADPVEPRPGIDAPARRAHYARARRGLAPD
jgi:xylulokinase